MRKGFREWPLFCYSLQMASLFARFIEGMRRRTWLLGRSCAAQQAISMADMRRPPSAQGRYHLAPAACGVAAAGGECCLKRDQVISWSGHRYSPAIPTMTTDRRPAPAWHCCRWPKRARGHRFSRYRAGSIVPYSNVCAHRPAR